MNLSLICKSKFLYIQKNGVVGRFVAQDVLQGGTFCGWDVLERGTFCRWDILYGGTFCSGTFCGRTFCTKAVISVLRIDNDRPQNSASGGSPFSATWVTSSLCDFCKILKQRNLQESVLAIHHQENSALLRHWPATFLPNAEKQIVLNLQLQWIKSSHTITNRTSVAHYCS